MQLQVFLRPVLATLGLGALAAPALAIPQDSDWAIGLYLGGAQTLGSDVELSLPGGTDLTYGDVSWESENFTGPIYYGARLTRWLGGSRRWGLALDYTHAKLVADLEETVPVSGSSGGMPVSGSIRLGDAFDKLQFTHGHNLVTVNGIYRWRPRPGAEQSLLDHLQPYVGIGAGVAIPHVEVALGTNVTDEYQLAGPAFQGLAGLDYRLGERLSLFGEYKLSYASLDADLTGGGSVRVAPWTNHFVLGLSYGF